MMHIGGLRTALYNYLYAKQNGGDFLLRIEDTDKNREVEGSIDNIVKSMDWVGLEWAEGPGSLSEKQTGSHGRRGPYLQSERLDIYQQFVRVLLEVSYFYFLQQCRMEMLIHASARQSACKL
jgi:nondiscriminating glutamyl-tRNA synthetase